MDTAWIDRLKLTALDPGRDAHVAVASLPLPAEQSTPPGFSGLVTQAAPVAWYPGAAGPGQPRRVLLLAASKAALPDTIGLTADCACGQAWTGPLWDVAVVSSKKTGLMMSEVNELVLSHNGRRLGLRLGVQLADRTRWWEWLQVEELWSGPVCKAIRAAGYVGIVEVTEEEWCDPDRYNHGEWYHKHNWLFVEVYARLFANGLVQVWARHVNNRIYDQGRDLAGFVPVIGFHTGDSLPVEPVTLDASRTDFALGDVQLDLSNAAHLISPERPGRLYHDRDMLVYQPYEGVEIRLGDGEPACDWKLDAGERAMWKGMARTVRFDLSFADRPILAQRYIAPYGWYGHCGTLWHDGVLPVQGHLDPICDRLYDHLNMKAYRAAGRFCRSSSWDGETPHAFLCQALRTGRSDLYERALLDAYELADVGIDHADFTIRIGGQRKRSISPTLQRTIGLLSAYLENGDPYLLQCAESVADAAYAIDRSNWPRRSVGRDAAYIRSIVRLYDVTGERFYLRRAGEACRRFALCQRKNGSFADQAGTYGSHASTNEIIKPWMNSILAEALVDYLERAGDDPTVEQIVIRTANWLLSVLIEDEYGAYWPYQVAWGDNEESPIARWYDGDRDWKHPCGEGQLEYNARTLLWVSRRTGHPKYARAYLKTFRRYYQNGKQSPNFSAGSKIPEDFPWHDAHVWNARWTKEGLKLDPALDLIELGDEGTIQLPWGATVMARRTASGVEIDEAPAPVS